MALYQIRVPDFVGRDEEMDRLADALSHCPAVVFIEGEAGIGKSRLVREFVASPAVSGRVLYASCPPFREPFTLGPLVDAFRDSVESVAGLPLSGLAGALRPLFPEWADALPPAPEPLGDASAAQHRLFRALVELLVCLQTRVLVVEDVHWADEATLKFLMMLAARQPRGICIVLTYRREDVPEGSLLLRLSSRSAADSTRLRLVLSPLDVPGTARMVSSMLAGEHVSEAFAAFLHDRTDGLPLAVEESVRLMRDRRDLRRRAGEWVRRDLDDIAVPPTIREAVIERTTRLTHPAQVTLQAAAVLSEPADEALLAVVSGLSEHDAAAGLSAALASGLLGDDSRGQLQFRHSLACRVVYEVMPALQRRWMHLRAGQALEQRMPQPVARLARHFREAGQTGQWSRYAEQAADLAIASGDHRAAVTLLHGVLTDVRVPADAVARVMEKMPLWTFSGYIRRGDLVQTLRSVLDRGVLAPPEQAEVRAQLGRLLHHLGEFEAGRAELEKAIPDLGHKPVEAARAMMLLAHAPSSVVPAAEHRRWLDQATQMMTTANSEVAQLAFAGDRASVLLLLGDEAGWDVAEQLPGETSSAQAAEQLARGHINIGNIALLWGDYREARHRLSVGAELAKRYDYGRLHALARGGLAHLDWLTGLWDGLADRAGALAETYGEPQIRGDGLRVAGLLDTALSPRAAEERLRLALDDHLQQGVSYLVIEPAAALARLYLNDDRVKDALAVTDAPAQVIAMKGIWLWACEIAPSRAEALVKAGRSEEAAEFVTAFSRGLQGCPAPVRQPALALCQAVLAEDMAQPEQAAILFGQAADAWHTLPRPYSELLARERQARCQLACGDQTGLELLGEVFTALSALGADEDAERVARVLRRHGVEARRPWRRGRRGYGDQLSPRETEVVRMVIDGKTNREIARALSRSPRTVAGQVNAAMRKLNVSSRTALAVTAVESGIVAERKN